MPQGARTSRQTEVCSPRKEKQRSGPACHHPQATNSRGRWTATVIRAEGGEEKIVYLIGGDKMCVPPSQEGEERMILAMEDTAGVTMMVIQSSPHQGLKSGWIFSRSGRGTSGLNCYQGRGRRGEDCVSHRWGQNVCPPHRKGRRAGY